MNFSFRAEVDDERLAILMLLAGPAEELRSSPGRVVVVFGLVVLGPVELLGRRRRWESGSARPGGDRRRSGWRGRWPGLCGGLAVPEACELLVDGLLSEGVTLADLGGERRRVLEELLVELDAGEATRGAVGAVVWACRPFCTR